LDVRDLVEVLIDFFAARVRPDLPAARLPDFLARCGTKSFDLGRGLRVIFAMIGIY
jgi:hypothetical protein